MTALVEIVSTQASDGVKLHGTLRQADAGAANATGLDVLILHHGVAGNFYGGEHFDAFSDLIAADGCAVLRCNNRGHDAVSWGVTPQGRRRLGAAFEIVDDCRMDWRAWIDFAEQRGFQRIGLLGHSLGATKTIYYMGTDKDPRVSRVIAASPPRFSYSRFLEDADGERFKGFVDMAQGWLDQDKPTQLIDADLPVPFLGSAATYVDKYGPHERTNHLKFIPEVPAPLLVLLGTLEPAAELPMRGLPEELQALDAELEHMTFEYLDGSDHFYTGMREHVWGIIRDWLAV